MDDATQAVYWKLEAIIIRAMKAASSMPHEQLVAHTLQQWQALGRPEPVGPELVLDRIAYLQKREWFALRDGAYHLTDISKK